MKNRVDHKAIFMPYLADLLQFMVIFERMLWHQSGTPAYHHPILRSSCFSKDSKLYLHFCKSQINSGNLFYYTDNCIWIRCLNNHFYWERILFIGCQCANKQSQDFRYYKNRIFWAEFLSEWSKNMTKILPCRFKQSFGLFNMLTIYKFSDTRLFRHLSHPAFCSL